MRKLEIGPGRERLPGFETLNIAPGPNTDHVGDARHLPFADGTFAEVYSSHCIEHLEWFDVEPAIQEWARVLRPGGLLEVHTVDAVPLLEAMLQWEMWGECQRPAGTWKQELHRGDPFLSAQARLLNYRKAGPHGDAWLHRAILTPRYLRQCFERAGLVQVREAGEPRGDKKHRAVNMGLIGYRPC